MYNSIKHITIDKLIALLLIMGGFLLAPLAVPMTTAVAEQPALVIDQKAEKSQQLESVTGTVLKQNESGSEALFLDTNAGEQVTIKGTVQGQTLTVHEVKKQ